MIQQLKKAWDEFIQPALQRPKRLQVAALCYRDTEDGKQVLLITSRGTGRWIIPKGWPIRGLGAGEAAMQEAWEEAGVRTARLRGDVIGTYKYNKIKNSGLAMPVETLVYPMLVEQMLDDFPEAGQRTRQWLSPLQAASLVQEPELQDILRHF